MRNTVRLGISSAELGEALGLTWVLHRQSLACRRWPRIGEPVRVVTLPTRIERRLITHRDFYLLDAAGAVLARSPSTWSVMHLESRRIRPIPDLVLERLGTLPAVPTLSHPADKPDAPVNIQHRRATRVTFAQLDFNNHLTNPAFPELMLEPLGLPFLHDHLPRAADIVYHREARYDDALTAEAGADGTGLAWSHVLRRDDGQPLATMVSQWSVRV